MAPKRQAPSPPPPPAASSEETASGSVSEEESEGEEEVAHSLPSATAPKTTAPPPQKGQESEGSDEEEDDEEEEEKTNHVAPPPATKNRSPPPQKGQESETTGDEEGVETDDEVPQPKPAPNQEADGKGAKPSWSEDKQPGEPFQRTWSTDDEVRILEALDAHRREHGTLPQIDALAALLAGSLEYRGCSLSVLQGKVRSLRRRYNVAGKKRELPSKDHDRRLFDLSKIVWGSTANDGARREVGGVCERYPYLAEEVRAVEKAYPGLFKREFEMIDDDKACALDEKIKRQRLHQARLHQKHNDLIKEVTRTLIDLTD